MYGRRLRKNPNRRLWRYVRTIRRHIWKSALQAVRRTRLFAVRMIVFFVLQRVAVCEIFGEVLRSVVHLADREIESCNTFFDVFVIRLKKK
jgi:hypothetical protein